jgi:hypothetical protein
MQVFIDKKSKRSNKIVEIKFFLLFCFLMKGCGSGTGSVQNYDGSGSGRPRSIRILRIRFRIHNTVYFPTHVPGKPLAMPLPTTIVLRSAGGLGCVWGGGWRADTHHMA